MGDLSQLFTISADFRSHGIEDVGRFAQALRSGGEGAEAAIVARLGVAEVLLLSTCNRFELWGYSDRELHEIALELVRWARPELDDSAVETEAARFQCARGEDAVQRVFRVSASLESMVVGEPQILGQVKDAFRRADEAGRLGTLLRQVLESAFQAAKEVRTSTGLAARPVSLATLAADAVVRHLGTRIGVDEVVLVGSGDMVRHVAMHLSSAGVTRLRFVNRTLAHAEELVAKHGGVAAALSVWLAAPRPAAAVVSATAAPGVVIGTETAARALGPNGTLFVDLAVPADLAPEVAAVPGATVIGLEQLRAQAESNQKERAAAIARAEPILARKLATLRTKLATRTVEPALKALREQLRSDGERSVEELLAGALAHLPSADKEVLRRWSQTLVNRQAHIPTVSLKAFAARCTCDAPAQALAELTVRH